MSWRCICKNNRLIWRTVGMHNNGDLQAMGYELETMCRHAVDLSCGELVEIYIDYFATDDLPRYITDRSKGIRRLRLLNCDGVSGEGLAEVAPKLPLLEELDITLCANISSKGVAAIGKSCPLLSSFKLNKEWCSFSDYEPYEYHFGYWYSSYYGQQQNQPFPFKNDYNRDAFATAGTMAVCAERIEKLWVPHDSTEGKDFVARSESYCFKWTDLPDNVTRSILSRAGAIEILTSAEKVCLKWFKICKDSSMWCTNCTIDMPNRVPIDDIHNYNPFACHDMCENAIERSCGNLVDINIESFGTNFLLDSLAQRASDFKRLRIVGLIELQTRDSVKWLQDFQCWRTLTLHWTMRSHTKL